jgi:hypothetical protein
LASLYQLKRGLIEVTDSDGVLSTKQLSRASAIEIGRYLIAKMKRICKIQAKPDKDGDHCLEMGKYTITI